MVYAFTFTSSLLAAFLFFSYGLFLFGQSSKAEPLTVPPTLFPAPTNHPPQFNAATQPMIVQTMPPGVTNQTSPPPVQTIPTVPQTVVVTNPPIVSNTNFVPIQTTTIIIIPTNILQPTGVAVAPRSFEPTVQDRLLTEQIRQAAQANFTTLSLPTVQISALNGRVTLQGVVDSLQTKEELLAIAGRYAGPNNVNDQLLIQNNVNE